MKIFAVELENEEPLIISKRRTSGAYYVSLQWIPGSTLAGAIINRIAVEDENTAKELLENLEFNVSPAVPTNGDARLSNFPLYYTTTVLKHRFSDKQRDNEKKFIFCLGPLLQKREKYKKKKGMYEVINGSIIKLSLDIVRHSHIRIHNAFRSIIGAKESGDFYNILAIAKGQKFIAKLLVPDNLANEIWKLNDDEIWIGALSRRGYGRTIIKIKEEKEIQSYLDERLKNIQKVEYILAISPVIISNTNTETEDILPNLASRLIHNNPNHVDGIVDYVDGTVDYTFAVHSFLNPILLRIPVVNGLAIKTSSFDPNENHIRQLELPKAIKLENRILRGFNWFEINHPITNITVK